MGRYDTRPELLAVSSRLAKPIISLKFRMLWRLYLYDPLLQRLAQDLEAMSFELGEFIGEEDAMVGQRHLARHGHLAAADQPHI
jgi:hypothetical protein